MCRNLFLSLMTLVLIIVIPSSAVGQEESRANNAAVTNLAKQPHGIDARVKFHITKTGIEICLENYVDFKGMQVDLENITSAPTYIKSPFMQSCTKLIGKRLRVLIFDLTIESFAPGNQIIAEIPVPIENPADIVVKNLIAAGRYNQKLNLEKPDGEISYTQDTELPSEFSLGQNYPNPFNPNTTITFAVPRTSDVQIMVYNLLGQEVCKLFAGQVGCGSKSIDWDGKDQLGRSLSSGTYIYRMQAGTFVESKKMQLIK